MSESCNHSTIFQDSFFVRCASDAPSMWIVLIHSSIFLSNSAALFLSSEMITMLHNQAISHGVQKKLLKICNTVQGSIKPMTEDFRYFLITLIYMGEKNLLTKSKIEDIVLVISVMTPEFRDIWSFGKVFHHFIRFDIRHGLEVIDQISSSAPPPYRITKLLNLSIRRIYHQKNVLL